MSVNPQVVTTEQREGMKSLYFINQTKNYIIS